MTTVAAHRAINVTTIRRGWWLALARTTDHVVTFSTQVLIARWVGPEEFGGFAVALLVVTILDSLTESGLAAALVHRETVDGRHLDVAWTLGVLRGSCLAIVMLVIAPLIADVVDAPAASSLIRWMALVPVLRALRSPGLPVLERRLAYRRLAVCGFAESSALLIGTLALVPFLDGVGALVGGIILGEAARVVASYLLARHVPRLVFDRAIAGELLRYGRWITGSSIALLVLLYMDDAVVAAVLGAGSLAVYEIAYQLAGVPATEIGLVGGQVSFSSMARVRDDRRRLARYFLDSYEFVACLAIPIAITLMITAGPLIDILLGPRWDDAVPIIRILALWGVLRALGSVMTALFRAEGRPDISTRQHWTMVACTGVFLLPLVELAGLVGVAAAVLGPNLVLHWRRYADVESLIEVSPSAMRGRLLGPALAGVAMAATMGLAALATSGAAPGVALVAALVAGGSAYLLTLALLDYVGRSDTFRRALLLVRGHNG